MIIVLPIKNDLLRLVDVRQPEFYVTENYEPKSFYVIRNYSNVKRKNSMIRTLKLYLQRNFDQVLSVLYHKNFNQAIMIQLNQHKIL